MGAAALDRTLAILIAAQLLTGLASLRAGTPASAPLFAVHGLLAGALLATVVLKLRRSIPAAAAARRWSALAVALLLAAASLAALVGGFAWVVSGKILTLGSWTVLTLHAWAALLLVPIALLHLLPHRWRILHIRRSRGGQPRVSRRTALATIGLALAGVAAWTAANALEALAGGSRRFTGSRWLPDGGTPPATTFFGEWPAPLAPDSWRLAVGGAVERPATLSLRDLARLEHETREEVLDCTSGWALRTRWGGVPLAAVLDAAGPHPGATRVTVRATTGWFATLPLDEARGALLATHVAGEPLGHGNGAPCRLVAPGRRGLEWVKWVTAVELGSRCPVVGGSGLPAAADHVHPRGELLLVEEVARLVTERVRGAAVDADERDAGVRLADELDAVGVERRPLRHVPAALAAGLGHHVPPPSVIGSKRAVKWRSCGGSSAIR